ncbi:hypothetical protein LOAG_12680 [Loa loa]|uniref:Uncharacterized protein n=1 Tax=Loa loa TaxID=7209 RepID=A0A1S0TLW2_LOALO|nr:hypothetical protein LOAG_12680 [Loa loa]EFO15830.1 hypothetical protein LOAG_12680 [Loa loa]
MDHFQFLVKNRPKRKEFNCKRYCIAHKKVIFDKTRQESVFDKTRNKKVIFDKITNDIDDHRGLAVSVRDISVDVDRSLLFGLFWSKKRSLRQEKVKSSYINIFFHEKVVLLFI